MPEKMTKAERARKVLLRMGYEEDELNQTFKSDEELLKFYAEVKATNKAAKEDGESEEEEGEEAEPEDDYKLPATEAAALESQRKLEQTQEKRIKTDAERAVFDQNVTPEPVEEGEKPVSYDDFMKSLNEGMTAPDDDVPNN